MSNVSVFSEALLTARRSLGATMIAKLEKRGHTAFYVDTAAEALRKVLELIPAGASVGVPGTVTIRQIGAIEALRERGNKVVHHWGNDGKTVRSQEELTEARFAENAADVLLVSTNAITEDGVMVNIDGAGNRVGGMCWSRGDRIFVVGMNKVCPDLNAAIARAHDPAAVVNATRLHSGTPCEKLGCHIGCVGPQSICRLILITDQAPQMPYGHKSYVILVGENLGF